MGKTNSDDLGTTAIKALVYDAAGENLAEKLEKTVGIKTKSERLKEQQQAAADRASKGR